MTVKNVIKGLLIFIKYDPHAKVTANGQSFDIKIKKGISISPDDMNTLEALGWVDDDDCYFLHNMM